MNVFGFQQFGGTVKNILALMCLAFDFWVLVFTVLHTLGKNWSFVPLVVTARGPRCDEWAVITPFSLPLKPTLHLGLREVPGFTKSLWRKELLNLY